MALTHYFSYLNTAEQIVAHYEGQEPFPYFIKAFFRNNKKFGSRDRKIISHLCYCFFRTGKSLIDLPVRGRILAGYFLSVRQSTPLLQTLHPEWDGKADLSAESKEAVIQEMAPDFSYQHVFPFTDELSSGIDTESFCRSHFIQPDVFLRIRKGNSRHVTAQLRHAGIPFRKITEEAIALGENAQIDKLFRLNKEVVIQDLSSQHTADYFPSFPKDAVLRIWDCCAGSGGKTLLAADYFPNAELTATDNRNTILRNFLLRMEEAEVDVKNVQVMDLGSRSSANEVKKWMAAGRFDLIIADVPCSGSGTWGRSPEEMPGFEKEEIADYAGLQRSIVSHAIPALKSGGYLLYITCSVYKAENEDNIAQITQMHNLKVVRQGIIEGYTQKADTMFAALLISPA